MTNDKSKEKGRFQLSISDGEVHSNDLDCVVLMQFIFDLAMVLMESAMYVWLLALAPDGDSSPISTQPFASTPFLHERMQFSFFEKSIGLKFHQNYIKNTNTPDAKLVSLN
jgi:hypothetical protein